VTTTYLPPRALGLPPLDRAITDLGLRKPTAPLVVAKAQLGWAMSGIGAGSTAKNKGRAELSQVEDREAHASPRGGGGRLAACPIGGLPVGTLARRLALGGANAWAMRARLVSGRDPARSGVIAPRVAGPRLKSTVTDQVVLRPVIPTSMTTAPGLQHRP